MRYLLLLFCGLFQLLSFGQSRVSSGGLFPEAQLTYGLNNEIKITAKIESQHGMVRNSNEQEADVGYFHDRTDFQGFVGKSFNPFISVAVGYQYRWDGEGEHSHRSIQQVSFVQPASGYRLGHRVRTDQTFQPIAAPEFRLRYRLVAEIPLDGSRIDPGEFYLLTSNEPIFAIQGSTFNIENRLVASLGHYFSKKQKLEAGIDYRADNFLEGGLRQRVWLKVGWFVNI